MANYVFLMELENNTLSQQDEQNLIKLTVTGCGLSFVGTMLSLCLICFLPMVSDGMFILCNLTVSLVCAQLAFIGAENSYDEKNFCKIATGILHYLFLCLHFSSLTYGIHLLLKLRPSQLMDRYTKRMSVMLISWGTPFVIVLLTASLHWQSYASSDLCWLPSDNWTRWAFLGPLLVIQLINGVIFVIVMSVRFYIEIRNKCRVFRVIRNQITTAISLAPVLGLTWSLGFAVTLNSAISLQYMFVILASTQGMLIFLGHVMTNNTVRKTLCATINPVDNDITNSSGISGNYTKSSSLVFEIDQAIEHGGNIKEYDLDNQKAVPHSLRVPENTCRKRCQSDPK